MSSQPFPIVMPSFHVGPILPLSQSVQNCGHQHTNYGRSRRLERLQNAEEASTPSCHQLKFAMCIEHKPVFAVGSPHSDEAKLDLCGPKP